jgi:hypothetical protein
MPIINKYTNFNKNYMTMQLIELKLQQKYIIKDVIIILYYKICLK